MDRSFLRAHYGRYAQVGFRRANEAGPCVLPATGTYNLLAAHGLCQLHHHVAILGALALHPKDLLVALKLADAPAA